jgi:hypothetical protein
MKENELRKHVFVRSTSTHRATPFQDQITLSDLIRACAKLAEEHPNLFDNTGMINGNIPENQQRLLANLGLSDRTSLRQPLFTIWKRRTYLTLCLDKMPRENSPEKYWWFAVQSEAKATIEWVSVDKYEVSPNGSITLPDNRHYPAFKPGWPEALFDGNVPTIKALGHLNALLRNMDANPLTGLIRSQTVEVRTLAEQIAKCIKSAYEELTAGTRED